MIDLLCLHKGNLIYNLSLYDINKKKPGYLPWIRGNPLFLVPQEPPWFMCAKVDLSCFAIMKGIFFGIGGLENFLLFDNFMFSALIS